MKKSLIPFLFLFFSLFFVTQKIDASFFDPHPATQNYGNVGEHARSVRWDPTGLHLAVGGIYYPTDVNIYQWDGMYLDPLYALSFGNGTYAVDWTPDGQYLAVGGSYGKNALMVYGWDGSTLTLTTSKYHGTQVNAVAWNPSGNTLAVGGDWGYNDLAIYNWDGAGTLTLTTSKYHGTHVNTVAWHPAGTKLAVGGANGTQDLILYNWSGSTLTKVTTKDHGTQASALAWSNSGDYLAVGGDNSYNDVIIYALSGSTLTLTASISFGTSARALAWSFDDKYLTVGGDNGIRDLITYEWDGATLTPVTSSQVNYGNGVYGVSWSPHADYLAVGGDNGLSDLTVYTSHGYFNGTKNAKKLSDHHLFSNGGYADGLVTISNGCTVLPVQTLTLALLSPFSGGLDLRNTGVLELADDLYFDANFTLSAGGHINGQGHAIYLGNNLTVPDNSILRITGDTIIDGQGHGLMLGHRAQLFVDSNVTLTLRNLTLKNTLNTMAYPLINVSGLGGILALDGVELAPTNDFYFNNGRLFIHHDVAFTGTSKFIYKSNQQSYITNNATLYFAPDTTLDYAPTSTSKTLLVLQDTSSDLYLDGCTLHVTHTGIRLTKGKLWFDNNITLSSALAEPGPIANSSLVALKSYGGALSSVNSVAWSPDGNYLAVGGQTPTDKQEIQVFNFNGTSLTYTASADYGEISNYAEILSVAWSPNGAYLAVGGYHPADNNEIQVFSFNGSALTKITGACKDFGSYPFSVAWSPDGNYLAVGGYLPDDGNEIQVFSFSGSALTKITGANYGTIGEIASVAWSPDGNYLAAGGYNPTDKQEIKVFNFNGTSLTYTASANYGETEVEAEVYSVAWSPDGNYLAVGGEFPTDRQEIKVFNFNGTSLTYTASTDYGKVGTYATVKSVAWSSDGKYLAAGGDLATDKQEIKVFDFNGTSLTYTASSDFGTQVYSVAWSPDGKYLGIGGREPGGGHDEIEVYKIWFSSSHQAESNAIIFGNSALGANYNLDIKLLNGANVDVKSMVKYDNIVS